MKKLLLSTVALLTFGFANAQQNSVMTFAKGDKFVEGDLSISGSSKEGYSDLNLNVSPTLGYFVSDKLALQASLSVGTKTTNTEGSVLNTTIKITTSAPTMGFALGARYYFLNLGTRFAVYTNFGVKYDKTSDTKERTVITGAINSDTEKTTAAGNSQFGVGAGLGLNYFVTPKFAISLGLSDLLSITSSKSNADEAKSTLSYGLNLNKLNNPILTPNFGVMYKF